MRSYLFLSDLFLRILPLLVEQSWQTVEWARLFIFFLKASLVDLMQWQSVGETPSEMQVR